jgi:hypothetical protein
MLGRKKFRPKLFYQLSLEEYVPEDHLLRRVAAVVNFGFVSRLTARFYSHTGQPGIDPVVLFKMALLGYLYGITSERRLTEETAAEPGLPLVRRLRPGRADTGSLGPVQSPHASGLPCTRPFSPRSCGSVGRRG